MICPECEHIIEAGGLHIGKGIVLLQSVDMAGICLEAGGKRNTDTDASLRLCLMTVSVKENDVVCFVGDICGGIRG